MNSLLCISSYTWIGRHLKETVILGNITWPEMGKHDVELGAETKKVYPWEMVQETRATVRDDHAINFSRHYFVSVGFPIAILKV